MIASNLNIIRYLGYCIVFICLISILRLAPYALFYPICNLKNFILLSCCFFAGVRLTAIFARLFVCFSVFTGAFLHLAPSNR
ncbi:hypothetical protein EG68_11113 [Paragonimus skrjabini miyazakii]|uniref:Uncharacterized protein n=1 Tax=Paragonimus skrjabini miyazakii TaxID=59628 RepID=A0A8S9YKA3_9TREM|nr:hypothetical protein EG68_11113 [Paragonimus skrjabini miyazakii]